MTAGRTVRERPTRARRGGASGWQVRTARRRLVGGWRILAAVGVVALLATTLISALALLASSAEQRSVRSALTEDPERSVVTVWTEQVDSGAEDMRTLVSTALADRLRVPLTVDMQASTPLVNVPRDGEIPALAYLAELEGVADHAVLVEGEWPGPWPPQGTEPVDGVVPVAVPLPAQTVLGLAVGSELALTSRTRGDDLRVRVVGVYDVPRPSGYWSVDRFDGELHLPDHPLPEYAGQVSTDAFGPLVPGTGTIDGLDLEISRLVLRHHPDLSEVTAADLSVLLDGVGSAEAGLSRAVGGRASGLRVTSTFAPVLAEVATTVVVVRAGVTVVALMLVVLAAAALLQTARLLVESRQAETDLMRARGASRGQLLVAAGVEALPLVVAVGVLGPVLAPLVVAAVGAVTGLTLPVEPPGTLVRLVGAGVAVGLGLVLLVPQLSAPPTFVEGQQGRARPDRRAALARSGVDVLMVTLGALAYWQLSTYRSPVRGSGSSVALDPVLVTGPVVVLLAAALLCVRLMPLAARLAERVAARGRGVVAPLASWEVGRRPARATSAVLLLTIALAVGSFAQTFLGTWGRSQEDQTRDALGAPVVADGLPAATVHQVDLLGQPPAGVPQPVVRRSGTLWPGPAGGSMSRPPGGTSVTVLGLTPDARGLLDRGRLAQEGGAVLAALPAEDPQVGLGVDLGEDAVGLVATLGLVGDDPLLTGVRASVSAMLADASGLVQTVELGTAELNQPSGDPVRVPLDDLTLDPAGRDGSLRLVGLATSFTASPDTDPPATVLAQVLVEDVAVLRSAGALAPTARQAATAFAGLEPDPVDLAGVDDWYEQGLGVGVEPGGPVTSTWVTLRGEALLWRQVVATRTAWAPGAPLSAAVTTRTAETLEVAPGDDLLLAVGPGLARLRVDALVPRVPTLEHRPAVVVDPVTLSRALAETGVAPLAVDEWWVDVADADLPAYLAGLDGRTDPDGRPTVDRVTAATVEVAEHQAGPVHAPTPAALWLATLGAAVVAALGFAVHTVVTVRARDVELAQLRAIGLHRGRLGAVVVVEAVLLCGLGVVFGTAVGVLLARLVGPLVATSAQGRAPVPAVEVVVPWGDLGLAAAGVVSLVLLVVAVVVRSVLTAEPASVLRTEAAR